MCTVPKPYPREFREDVIRVARNREPGVRIKDVAADFGISESCLQNWLTQADRDDGVRVTGVDRVVLERERVGDDDHVCRLVLVRLAALEPITEFCCARVHRSPRSRLARRRIPRSIQS